jgi:hypothetical protein
MATCTVVVGFAGERCGQPAVVEFTGTNGERFAECEKHCAGASAAKPRKAATLRFTAFGKQFKTASTAAYIIISGPYDRRVRQFNPVTRQFMWLGQTERVETHVHGYAYSLDAAMKRVRRQLAGVPHAIVSLSTGQEVK